MAGTPVNLEGHTYDLLTVTRQAGIHTSPGPGGTRSATWFCDCQCGKKDIVKSARYLRSATDAKKSCGCVHAAKVREMLVLRNTTHGQTETRLYSIWSGMKRRCQNEHDAEYPNYGGRGIKVCPEWTESFEAFARDVGEPPTASHTLDRRDTNGDYTKENCRWATPLQQNNNRRNTTMLTFQDRTQSLMEWSRELGIPRCTLRYRIRKGWAADKILSQQE